MSLTTRQAASQREEDSSAHFLTSPRPATPKDTEDGRFLVSNTALEILNGYTKSQEEKKQGLQQVYEKTKLPDVRQSTGRHLLYRYEMNGIVVYDSHARCCDEHNQKTQDLQKSQGLTAAVKKEIEGAPDYDKAMYANMPQYPKTKTLPEEYTLVIPLENTLRFDSKFESGNLRKAVKICDDEYILLQDYDVDTKGHTQWFYFSVRNEKAGHKVRFSIVNLMKYDSLYNNGLKPLVLSAKKERWSGVDWHRTCDTVSYYQNNIPRTPSTDTRLPHFYYTLSFTYTFEYDHDLVYFAHCYPYCYSTLQSYISSAAIRSEEEDILRVDSLCTTHTGNTCPVLTITSNISTYSSWEDEFSLMMKSAAGRKMIRQREERKEAHLKSVEQVRNVKLVQETGHRRKKGVILSARVHPGETNSSYMMQGAIDFLLSDCKEAKILRRHFVFKVIPMLNPDGVIYGNYRCSLIGVDLNRRWQNPNKHLHPTIYYAKRLFQMFSEQHEVVMYCDMHGHSMKKNVFMYACARKGVDPDIAHANILSKMIPMMLAQTNKIFSVKDTKFRLEKSKEGTARIVMYKELGILNSYTLEASFYGPSHIAALQNRDPEQDEPNGDSHLRPEHLEGLGKDLCKICLHFINPALFRRKLDEVSRLIREAATTQVPSFMLSRRKKDRPQPPPTETPPQVISSTPSEDLPQQEPCSAPISEGCSAFGMTNSMLEELQGYEEEQEQGYFTEVLRAIEERPDLGVLARPDEESDSGGSDSIGSDNDDQKLEIVGKIAAFKEKQRSKSANRKKVKIVQRSDSVLKSKPLPVKAVHPSKPLISPCKPDPLHTLYPFKSKEESSPRLKKGRSSQSFVEGEVVFCQVRKEEEKDESTDLEPRVKIAKAAGGYQNFSVPPRPDIGFSPSSSFIITSIHHPNSSILTGKLHYLRKPSLNAYRRTQRPSRIPPLPRSSDPRGRPLVSNDSTRHAEISPMNTSLCPCFDSKRFC